jgi:demethylmenaquinone methyltransferase/2-methoxy-6-polyprenyl-1,4-benzoquinol methylase
MAQSLKSNRKQDSLISADDNRAMFNHIARYYDTTNRILSFGFDSFWRRRAVSRLALIMGSIYLDVGCGTGDMAVEIVKRAPGSEVIGIDPSEGMLAVGREKVKAAGLDQAIALLEGNVLDLQFADDTFDGAITAFCIRNVTDRKRGLSEMYRVVRPGGLVVVLELTQPLGPIMKPLFRVYGSVLMPLLTAVLSSRSAYKYLTDSMADFPNPNEILRLFGEVGFVNQKYGHMTGGIVTLFEGQVPPTQQ